MRQTRFAAIALLASLAASSADAMEIKRVISPGGIEAWLVESHANPLIAMRFAFRGGAAQDPRDRQGLAYFVSGMMDEGAGGLDSVAFQERLQSLATRMDFDAGRDVMLGNVQMLTANKDESFELLRLAMSKPRFDADAIERVRGQIIAGLKFDENDPEEVASLAWDRLAFRDHPYGRPIKGTKASIAAITRDDLHGYLRRVFARDKLAITVVGDIDAETLGRALDHVFGALPQRSELAPVADVKPPLGPAREIIEMNVPQSVAQFGHRAFSRKDDDFMAAYILNYIIGGGGFSSRLMEEVREKLGGAKSYLTGAYALRFESSSSIANQLLWIQIEDLGIDYIDRRNTLIENVSLDDIRRVAKRLIDADRLITTIVGKPVEARPKAAPG